MFPANGSLLATPPFPRSGPSRVWFPDVLGHTEALRLPIRALPVTYLVRFRVPRDSSLVRVRCFQRSQAGGGLARARIIVQPAIPFAGSVSRGREWDLSGSQTILPVPLPRSGTPAGPTSPRQLTVSSVQPLPLQEQRLQR